MEILYGMGILTWHGRGCHWHRHGWFGNLVELDDCILTSLTESCSLDPMVYSITQYVQVELLNLSLPSIIIVAQKCLSINVSV